MRRRVALILVVVGLGLGLAQAQEKAKTAPAKGAPAKPAKPPNMTVPQSAEMAKLAKMMVGNWTLNMKFEAIPEMGPEAQAGTGKGTDVIKAGPAGNSIISDVRSTSTSGAFNGHGVIWWDAKARAFRSVWCDNESPGGCEATAIGKWEGDKLVFTQDAEFPGTDQKAMIKMKMRQTYSDFKAASFTFAIDGSFAGGPMKHMMTINYKK